MIDDSAADARLFETALLKARTRAHLYWVATAQEGLEYLGRKGRFAGALPVSMVVCDLNMPGMDGFEFLANVKKNSALAGIPVIIFSSAVSHREINRCYELGATSFIEKPMTLATMVSRVGLMVRYWLDVVTLPVTEMPD